MGERGHNTNLAAEYYVLSMLYRVGADAYLTLGNKKSIDIVVEAQGTTLTADVKGLRDPTCFPIDNCTKREAHHFVVFGGAPWSSSQPMGLDPSPNTAIPRKGESVCWCGFTFGRLEKT